MGDGGEESLAPVIPLFGGAEVTPTVWNDTWAAPSRDDDAEPSRDDDAQAIVDAGEAALLRKLRTRSLSVREARAALIEREVDEASTDAILERFVGNGYLDDAKLAEQLIHTGVERKGQGRGVISQTLAKRGIPREVIDAALEELPDDELERALEFARGKARSMRDLDREVALRRLSGQLARRGYGGRSYEAARRALDEVLAGGVSTGTANRGVNRAANRGVRFEP